MDRRASRVISGAWRDHRVLVLLSLVGSAQGELPPQHRGQTCGGALALNATGGKLVVQLPAGGTEAFPGREGGGGGGLWVRLDNVRTGLLELSTCGTDGVDSDLAIHESCGEKSGPWHADVSETRLRCAGGERRRLYDVIRPGPIYVRVRLKAGVGASLHVRTITECEAAVGSSASTDLWRSPARGSASRRLTQSSPPPTWSAPPPAPTAPAPTPMSSLHPPCPPPHTPSPAPSTAPPVEPPPPPVTPPPLSPPHPQRPPPCPALPPLPPLTPGALLVDSATKLRAMAESYTGSGNAVSLWLPPGTTLTLGGAPITVSGFNLTLTSGEDGAAVDGEGRSLVFNVTASAALVLQSIMVRGGVGVHAGGISTTGIVLLRNSSIGGCHASSEQSAAGGMFVYGGSVSLDGSTIVNCSGTAQTNVRSVGRRVCWVGEGWGVRPSARGWRACAAWRGRGAVRSGHCPGARVQ